MALNLGNVTDFRTRVATNRKWKRHDATDRRRRRKWSIDIVTADRSTGLTILLNQTLTRTSACSLRKLQGSIASRSVSPNRRAARSPLDRGAVAGETAIELFDVRGRLVLARSLACHRRPAIGDA